MNWIGTAIATFGACWCLLTAVGLLRLRDPITRLQAVTKASTLGLALIMVGIVLLQPRADFAVKSALVVIFLFLVAPVSGHLIGRAAYRAGLKGRLEVDELERDRNERS